MTTFKAVDGWTTEHQIANLKFQDIGFAAVGGDAFKEDGILPCTIIPGHWAERIESGELLTEEEMQDASMQWAIEGKDMSWSYFLQRTIARKLRGEA